MKARSLSILVVAIATAGCGHRSFPYRELARPAKAVFPAPPRGAVVLSRQDGDRALAIGVASAAGGTLVRVSVVGAEGRGTRGLAVRVRVATHWERAAVCGPGCYQTSFSVRRPRTVDLQVRGRTSATRWHVQLPAQWPPRDASTIVRRAGRVWRSLRSLTIRDHLATDARNAVDTTWWMVAPDRVAYHVAGRGRAVIIGSRRWDRQRGGRWIASRQDPPLRQPVPFWVAATDAHVLGSATVRGRAAWRISFFDPKTPAWFEVLLDKRTLRTLDLRMNTTAHFMHERYGAFDAPIRIRPPR